MTRLRSLTLAAVLLLIAGWAMPTQAAGPEIGKPAPGFDLEGTDGQQHKLSDYKGKIVVLQWQGNECPWDKAYRPVLTKMYNQYHMTTPAGQPAAANGVQVVFLGINSNFNETMKEIKAVREASGLPYPILKDLHNTVADLYDAKTTPHMFVIDRDGILRYKGGIEKAPLSPDDVGQSADQYLGPVLAAITTGKTLPFTETVSKGCGIKRERQ